MVTFIVNSLSYQTHLFSVAACRKESEVEDEQKDREAYFFVPCLLDVGQGREGVTLFLIRLTTFNIVLLFTSSGDWRKWTYLVNGSLRVGDLKTKFSCNLRIATGSKYHSYETTSQQRSWMEFGKYNSFKRQSTPL